MGYNYEDVYMMKDNEVMRLRIIFTEDSTHDKEYRWDGKKFIDAGDIDFDKRYHELQEEGYREAWMSRDYYGDVHFEEV